MYRFFSSFSTFFASFAPSFSSLSPHSSLLSSPLPHVPSFSLYSPLLSAHFSSSSSASFTFSFFLCFSPFSFCILFSNSFSSSFPHPPFFHSYLLILRFFFHYPYPPLYSPLFLLILHFFIFPFPLLFHLFLHTPCSFLLILYIFLTFSFGLLLLLFPCLRIRFLLISSSISLSILAYPFASFTIFSRPFSPCRHFSSFLYNSSLLSLSVCPCHLIFIHRFLCNFSFFLPHFFSFILLNM